MQEKKRNSFPGNQIMEKLEGWKDLGVVSTIYEEEEEEGGEEEGGNTGPSLSPTLALPLTPLHSRVEAWSLATGCEPDVLIHVQGSSFHLHKELLSSRSGYLKSELNELSEIILSPPLNITAETFTFVADFCYGSHVLITPFNVVSLRVAAELLEMTETNGPAGDENLGQRTETYFCRSVGMNRECASIIFKSCLSMLPEAETTAALVSRCIESLNLLIDGDGNNVLSCIDDVKMVQPEDFQIVVESMQCRLTGSDDLLYRIVDLYLKEHSWKITEEQKTKICNCIDCTALSPQLLIQAVRNPRMPLRFIVQAMFVDQLHTRRSIFSAATTQRNLRRGRRPHHSRQDPITLGAILQRDAALRHSAQLKASMDATTSRIKCLEKELDGMKKLLRDSEIQRTGFESRGSVSSRFEFENRIERGQTGSVSSSSLRGFMRREKVAGGSSSECSSDGNGVISSRIEKSTRKKMVDKLKFAFGASAKKKYENTEGEKHGTGDVIVIKKDIPFHKHSHSLG